MHYIKDKFLYKSPKSLHSFGFKYTKWIGMDCQKIAPNHQTKVCMHTRRSQCVKHTGQLLHTS